MGAEIDLLSLQELYDVLENYQELVNLVYDWEFVMSRDLIYYEWTELPQDLCVTLLISIMIVCNHNSKHFPPMLMLKIVQQKVSSSTRVVVFPTPRHFHER